ncbi:MAG: carboxymuconolactone decarboxylase family protein [Bacteroidota bacterium]
MPKLPKRYTTFLETYPEVANAYHDLGDACSKAGPLDEKTRALVRLGIAVGRQHEGAVHSHARKALEAGASEKEIHHAVILSTTTIGFPAMMAALSWVDDILSKRRKRR